MPSQRCCGTSVGVIIRDAQEHLLMIERGWYPVGIAPVAGHVADAHTDPTEALAAEVREETGLEVTSHTQVWEGWLPNLCASPPAPIPGHYWWLATAEVEGDLTPDPVETKGAAWYTPEEVRWLADRTLAHGRGEVTAAEFAAAPGLEPVWLHHLHAAGLLQVTEAEQEIARRLYTTPPREYWLDERPVPAETAAEFDRDPGTRCTCPAVLDRVHAEFGHLEGRRVTARNIHDPAAPTTGTLHVSKPHPGYLWISRRGGDPDYSRLWHVDDIDDLYPNDR